MSKKMISTPEAPAAIGPYSQAVSAGDFLFVSGQIGLQPGTGELVEGGVTAQTTQVMENLKAIIQAAGASLHDVVKCTIYLKDMSDFGKVNDLYGSYFGEAPPARATVEVSRLPKDVAVEIDAIVLLK